MSWGGGHKLVKILMWFFFSRQLMLFKIQFLITQALIWSPMISCKELTKGIWNHPCIYIFTIFILLKISFKVATLCYFFNCLKGSLNEILLFIWRIIPIKKVLKDSPNEIFQMRYFFYVQYWKERNTISFKKSYLESFFEHLI